MTYTSLRGDGGIWVIWYVSDRRVGDSEFFKLDFRFGGGGEGWCWGRGEFLNIPLTCKHDNAERT